MFIRAQILITLNGSEAIDYYEVFVHNRKQVKFRCLP